MEEKQFLFRFVGKTEKKNVMFDLKEMVKKNVYPSVYVVDKAKIDKTYSVNDYLRFAYQNNENFVGFLLSNKLTEDEIDIFIDKFSEEVDREGNSYKKKVFISSIDINLDPSDQPQTDDDTNNYTYKIGIDNKRIQYKSCPKSGIPPLFFSDEGNKNPSCDIKNFPINFPRKNPSTSELKTFPDDPFLVNLGMLMPDVKNPFEINFVQGRRNFYILGFKTVQTVAIKLLKKKKADIVNEINEIHLLFISYLKNFIDNIIIRHIIEGDPRIPFIEKQKYKFKNILDDYFFKDEIVEINISEYESEQQLNKTIQENKIIYLYHICYYYEQFQFDENSLLTFINYIIDNGIDSYINLLLEHEKKRDNHFFNMTIENFTTESRGEPERKRALRMYFKYLKYKLKYLKLKKLISSQVE